MVRILCLYIQKGCKKNVETCILRNQIRNNPNLSIHIFLACIYVQQYNLCKSFRIFQFSYFFTRWNHRYFIRVQNFRFNLNPLIRNYIFSHFCSIQYTYIFLFMSTLQRILFPRNVNHSPTSYPAHEARYRDWKPRPYLTQIYMFNLQIYIRVYSFFHTYMEITFKYPFPALFLHNIPLGRKTNFYL